MFGLWMTVAIQIYPVQIQAEDLDNASPSSCEPKEDHDPSPCCAPVCRLSQYCGPNCIPAPYCNEVNIWGELLYWKGSLCGLESAFGSTKIATTTIPGFTITTVTESDELPDFKWRLGWRIGADYAFTCFDLEAFWTHFDGRANFHKNNERGLWKLYYDTIDLIFGRRCPLTPCVYFKPFIGVRAARIKQLLKSHLHVVYTGSDAHISFIDMKDREHFLGIGPELGIEANWYLKRNFTLFATFDIVTYYGERKGKNHDTDTFPTTIVINNSKTRSRFNQIATDAEIGIRWDKAWPVASEVLLTFKAVLEQHRIYDFSNLGSDGTLSIDGASFEARLGYRF